MPALVALITLGVVQLSVQVVAIMDLAKRSQVAGGRKWVWIVIAVLGGLIGATVYLAVGRKADGVSEGDASRAGNEGARRRALDTLYGTEKRRD